LNVLLDTHIALWAVEEDPRFGASVRAVVLAPDTRAFVSMASLWEIAIKHPRRQTGPGAIRVSSRVARAEFLEAGFSILEITEQHIDAVETLPSLHGDPFDRMLVAQALSEPLRLITRDKKVAAYSDSIILV
jgi:PIN domain nuclease of toxin-antitoxin system